ncbi:hypothetical protein V6N11_078192 [Hibiscus sabdariffa]|uniref:Endonuclease/exonuclease/phosphatase domain-containing protein n=1 Tax=Hibiscus sabdariffa TaxID=183260 RepID=A0ABR2TFD8_9ROSI
MMEANILKLHTTPINRFQYLPQSPKPFMHMLLIEIYLGLASPLDLVSRFFDFYGDWFFGDSWKRWFFSGKGFGTCFCWWPLRDAVDTDFFLIAALSYTLLIRALLYHVLFSMAMVAWNVRGLGNKDTVRALKNVVFKHRAEIIFLSETKQKKRYIEKIRMKMKVDNAFYVEPEGIAGGLALWWSNEVKLSVLHYDRNFIDAKISINGEPEWFGTFIYAPLYSGEKYEFWDSLTALRNDINAKWCIIGDFNVVVCPEEKYEGVPFDHNMLSDRVVSSLEWNFLFPKAISFIDIAIASDHSLIILLTNGVVKNTKKDFKFESRWLMESKCSRVIQEEWENRENGPSRGTFRIKLRRTRVKLSKWNKEKFGTNRSSAEEIQKNIKEL